MVLPTGVQDIASITSHNEASANEVQAWLLGKSDAAGGIIWRRLRTSDAAIACAFLSPLLLMPLAFYLGVRAAKQSRKGLSSGYTSTPLLAADAAVSSKEQRDRVYVEWS